MSSEDSPDRQERVQDTLPTSRKPYEKPELVVYGDLAAITRSRLGSHHSDGAGHPNRHFTS